MSVVWFGMVCVTRRRGLQTIRQGSRHHRCNSEHMWLRPPCVRLRVLYSLFPQSEVSSSLTRFCNLSQSTTAPRGWATPFVPSLLGTAIILIVSFVLWEIRREAKGQSVLLPMSMFSQPGAKMGPVVLLVVFGWWGFNTQGYFIPLFFQQVKGLSPLKTALWLVPSGVSVSVPCHRMLESKHLMIARLLLGPYYEPGHWISHRSRSWPDPGNCWASLLHCTYHISGILLWRLYSLR